MTNDTNDTNDDNILSRLLSIAFITQKIILVENSKILLIQNLPKNPRIIFKNRRKKNQFGGENKISQDSMGSLSRKVHKGRRGGYRYSDLGMKGISIDFGELRKKQRKTLKAKKKKLSKQKKAKKHGKGTKRVKRKRVQSRRKK